jgi:hypothetical protein
MSELSKAIDSLEVKFFTLAKKLQNLTEINQNLLQELNQYKDLETNQDVKIKSLEQELETIKFANSLLGSEENKRETKLKINSLIREIDHCITQLSE